MQILISVEHYSHNVHCGFRGNRLLQYKYLILFIYNIMVKNCKNVADV